MDVKEKYSMVEKNRVVRPFCSEWIRSFMGNNLTNRFLQFLYPMIEESMTAFVIGVHFMQIFLVTGVC